MNRKIKSKKLKVFVAMSGGVDSSVASKLLKDQGHEVAGIFLHFWRPAYAEASAGEGRNNFDLSAVALAEAENKCCSLKALADARRVCQAIGIPLYTLNFSQEFKNEVVDNFLDEYKNGRTPNPCVRCNKLVKLGLLIKKARELDFDYVASGHYVKNQPPTTNHQKYKLYRAKDQNKDQSYFLYKFNQDQLARLLFPLGDYTKAEVRAMAKKFKLPVADKKESQEICFIPEKNHNEFLKRHLTLNPGAIKTLDGKTIGQHQGLPLYTIGQRKGVDIGGIGPFYVVKKNIKTNTLYVVSHKDDKALYNDELIVKNINWIAGHEPKLPLKCQAVIRYRHQPVDCLVVASRRGGTGPAKGSRRIKPIYPVKLKPPQRAITPGQSVVFYHGDEILGGGVIEL